MIIMSTYIEDTFVQQTTADYQEQQLGLESLSENNKKEAKP